MFWPHDHSHVEKQFLHFWSWWIPDPFERKIVFQGWKTIFWVGESFKSWAPDPFEKNRNFISKHPVVIIRFWPAGGQPEDAYANENKRWTFSLFIPSPLFHDFILFALLLISFLSFILSPHFPFLFIIFIIHKKCIFCIVNWISAK